MKNFLKQIMFFVILATSQNIYSSAVNIDNKTLFKVKAGLDVVMYPDPQKEIGSNSKISENIGSFFMRGITIGFHIGDRFLENVLSESVSATLGFGDVNYYILSAIKNLGRGKFIDENVLEFTFYLIRVPKFMYTGGIVSKTESKPIFVATRNLETFKVVDEDYLKSCNTMNVCATTPYVTVQQVPANPVVVQQVPTVSESVSFGGTVIR